MISSSHPKRLVVAGYLRDFPGIERWVTDDRHEVSVELVDFDLLNSEPRYDPGDTFDDYSYSLEYYLMSRDKKTLLSTVKGVCREVPLRLFKPSTWGRFLPAEKVVEAMGRLSEHEWLDLGYVVGVDNRSIVIYKMPKRATNMAVHEFLEERRCVSCNILSLQ